MTLKIKNIKDGVETHLVTIEDGAIYITYIPDGSDVSKAEMEAIFPDFVEIIQTSTTNAEVMGRLQVGNYDYNWAHVSGKL